MTKNNDWRIPNDEEKELALFWIKRNRTGNISFAMCCFWFLFAATVAYVVSAYIFKPEYFENTLKASFILLPFICLLGGFNIFNMITEIEKVHLVAKGDFQIIDARVQFVGKKRLSRYSYMNVVEATYRNGFGPKPTTFSVSRKVKKRTNVGDNGFVIRFLHGNIWTKKALVFIPNNK